MRLITNYCQVVYCLLSTVYCQVVQILRTSGSPDLYSPEIESERRKAHDPVTTDLLGALLAVRSVSFFHPIVLLPDIYCWQFEPLGGTQVEALSTAFLAGNQLYEL